MERHEQTVFLDQEVLPRVIAILEKANKYAFLVTPYLDLKSLGHLTDAVDMAVGRKVDVRFIIRADEEETVQDDVNRLMSRGVRMYQVPRLHAKIYLNETAVLVSSMNITTYSTTNSHEIALLVTQPEEVTKIRSYVTEHLMKLGEQIAPAPAKQSTSASAKQTTAAPVSYQGGVRPGFCIRCGIPVALDPGRPLCDNCYRSWAEWSNPEYPEKMCHFCGQPAEVSYNKPLCFQCFRSAHR